MSSAKILKFGTSSIGKVGSNVIGFDQYFQASRFITVANITDTTQQDAVKYLVQELVDNNLMSKFSFIYPMVGGGATRHSYNLVDTSKFQLTFSGGWTHSTTGATPNDTNTYANTGFNPVTAGLTYNNNHLSYYSRTTAESTVGNNYDMGSGNSTQGGTALFVRRFFGGSNSAYDTGTAVSNRLIFSNTDGRGFYIGSSILTNIGYYYKNGVQQATKNPLTSVAMQNYNYYLGAFNEGNTGNVYYSNKECAFASAGQGLTPSEMVIFSSIVQQFQTILGRNV